MRKHTALWRSVGILSQNILIFRLSQTVTGGFWTKFTALPIY